MSGIIGQGGSKSGIIQTYDVPAQIPAFNGILNNLTNFAVSTHHNLISTERFDVLGNFDGTTFTAPVSGLYQFNATLVLGSVVIASGEYFRYRIITSNKTYDPLFDPRAFDAVPGHWALSHSVLADMDEGDTATFSIYTNNSSATADILGTETGWSGFLVQETL